MNMEEGVMQNDAQIIDKPNNKHANLTFIDIRKLNLQPVNL